MTAQSHDDETESPASPRPARWLPVLETALKSRVGWWDEAISPFARTCHGTKLGTSTALVPVVTMEPAVTTPAANDRAAAQHAA
jgi:hypothetical protein